MVFILYVFRVCSAKAYLKALLSIVQSVPHSQFFKHVAVQGPVRKHFRCNNSLVLTFKIILNCTAIFVFCVGFLLCVCIGGLFGFLLVGRFGLGFLVRFLFAQS